ncbi:MAG: diguanylate cyclase [Halioglobus sp.]|nr:diguanylate cyclase [Halioglobus sp.]
MNNKALKQSKGSLRSRLNKLPDWLFRLCTGSPVYDALNEEHYRQRILVMISCFWLLSAVFFSVMTPLLIKLDFRGHVVAQALFFSTIFGVVISMLVLRFSGNRMKALNVMLLIYTSAFFIACLIFGGSQSPTYPLLIMAPAIAAIAGSIVLSAGWGLLVVAIWVGLFIAESNGAPYTHIIAPDSRGIATLLACSALAIAVVSVIIIYAEMNKALRLSLQSTNLALEHLSSHDQLTQLPNRRVYNERIENALQRAAERDGMVSLLFIDLNGFKKVNDTYGHGAGDKLLIATAQRIRNSLRETDLVARLGGDEFVVVVEGATSVDEITRLAHKLSQAIEKKLCVRQQPLTFSAGIGVATFPLDGRQKQELEEKADRAMYLAKNTGVPVALASDEFVSTA